MKRFSKLERARGPDDEDGDVAAPAAAKRFEAIEKARAAAAPAADPFRPAPDTSPPVQLELHDRYTEQVEEARQSRQRRATQELGALEAQRAARALPHRAPDVLDVVVHGLAIGPLASIPPERRLWGLGASLLVLWFGVGYLVSGLAALIASAVLVAILFAVGWLRRRAT